MSYTGEYDLFENLGTGRLASSLTSTQTEMVLSSGDGNNFPSLEPDQVLHLTLVSAEARREVVLATGRVGDVFTVLRGQDGTTARTWPAGSIVAMRVVREVLNKFVQQGEYDEISAPSVPCTPGRWGYDATTKKWYLCSGSGSWGEVRFAYWSDVLAIYDEAPSFSMSLADFTWDETGKCMTGQRVDDSLTQSAKVFFSDDGGYAFSGGVAVGPSGASMRTFSTLSLGGDKWLCCNFQDTGERADIRVYVSEDNGSSWSLSQTIPASEGLARSADSILTSDGAIYLGFQGTSESSFEDVVHYWSYSYSTELWEASQELPEGITVEPYYYLGETTDYVGLMDIGTGDNAVLVWEYSPDTDSWSFIPGAPEEWSTLTVQTDTLGGIEIVKDNGEVELLRRLVWRSLDSGASWTATSGLSGQGLVFQLFECTSGAIAAVVADAGSSVTYKSDDGSSWENTGLAGISSISEVGGDIVALALDDDGIWSVSQDFLSMSLSAEVSIRPLSLVMFNGSIFAISDKAKKISVVSSSDGMQSVKTMDILVTGEEYWNSGSAGRQQPAVWSWGFAWIGHGQVCSYAGGVISRGTGLSADFGFNAVTGKSSGPFYAFADAVADASDTAIFSSNSISGAYTQFLSLPAIAEWPVKALSVRRAITTSSGNTIFAHGKSVYTISDMVADSKVIHSALESDSVYGESDISMTTPGGYVFYYGGEYAKSDASLLGGFAYISSDEGQTWEDISLDAGVFTGFVEVAGGRILGFKDGGRSVYSDDNGVTWTESEELDSPYTWSFNGRTGDIFVVGRRSNGDCLGGSEYALWHSADNGVSWAERMSACEDFAAASQETGEVYQVVQDDYGVLYFNVVKDIGW